MLSIIVIVTARRDDIVTAWRLRTLGVHVIPSEQSTIVIFMPRIDDRSFVHAIPYLTRYEQGVRVQLNQTHLAPASLLHLNRLEGVEFLDLTHSGVTDGEIEQLHLPKLRTLILGDTAVTDRAIHSLRSARVLDYLELDNTPVTDRCIDDLIAITSLRFVGLMRTNVTEHGIETLRLARPDLVFDWLESGRGIDPTARK